MNQRITKATAFIFSTLLIVGCEPELSDPLADPITPNSETIDTSTFTSGGTYSVNASAATSGSADFTNYVAIGDSLTAGYADRALYKSGQENSYPNVLATQFAAAGGGAFVQPLMGDNNLGGLLFGTIENPDFANRLIFDIPSGAPVNLPGTPEVDAVLDTSLHGTTFNNMGVPGAKSFHLGAVGYGNVANLGAGTSNPYFVRFAKAADNTVITDVLAQAPTFFTFWIGNNDILSFATTGGAGVDQTGNFDPTSYGSNDITDPVVYASTITGLLDAITGTFTTAKGVLLNIPDVSTIPVFTTIPYNPTPLDSATASALNTAYADYNNALQAAAAGAFSPLTITSEEAAQRTITFSAGDYNAMVMLDEDLTDLTAANAALVNMRLTTSNDLIPLPTLSKLGTLAVDGDPTTVWGVGAPLLDGDVLSEAEISLINTATTAYNASIKAYADADVNLTFVDTNQIMSDLHANGLNYGTGSITSAYVTGGGFSLDGTHPTARGYAVIANEIISAINTAFSANIHTVDPSQSTTVLIQ